MKKLLMLVSLIIILFLMGCEVKEKMVVQYTDHQETILVDYFESELGFSMNLIYGTEVEEDEENKRVEISEPFPMYISQIDKDVDIYSFMDQIRMNNSFEMQINNYSYFDPSSIHIPFFDLFILDEINGDTMLILIKETTDYYYLVELSLPLDQFNDTFPKLRSILSTFSLADYVSIELTHDILYRFFPSYKGEIEGIDFNYLFLYDLINMYQSQHGELSNSYGELSNYDNKEDYFLERIWEMSNIDAPTGDFFHEFMDRRGFIEDVESTTIHSLYHLDDRPNGRAGFYFYHLPDSMTLRYTFAEIDSELEQIYIIQERIIPIQREVHDFQVEYLNKSDVYYAVIVELLAEDDRVIDSIGKIIYIPPYEAKVRIALDNHLYKLGELIHVEIQNEGTIHIFSYQDPIIEMYENGEWWVIPFDGYYKESNFDSWGLYLVNEEKFLLENIETEGLLAGEYRLLLSFHYVDPDSYNTEELSIEEMILAVPFTLE